MTLYEQFIKFSKENGIDMSDAFTKREKNYDMIAFGEEAKNDNNLIYNVVLVFYNIEDIAEVYIRKQIALDNRTDVLNRLNNYNACYRGVSFFLDFDFINMKSFCVAKNNIRTALDLLANNMIIAQDLFKEFKGA